MDKKSLLLEQLRIERPPEPAPRTGSRRGARTGSLIGIAVAVLVAVGCVAFWKGARAGAVSVQAVIARTLTPRGTDVAVVGSQLDAAGYVVALRDATVSAKAIYKVNEVLVQQGEVVKLGQIVARLDDSNVRAALEESIVQVQQARASLAQAKLAADDNRPIFLRQQRELAEGLITQDAFDTAKSNYDAAQAQVVVAEQNLAVGQAVVIVNRRLEDDTVIRAPFDGVVTAKNAQPGQIVSPQFSGGGGLAEVVDMNSLEVDVDVSENFISRVHPRQAATITLDAYPSSHIPAEVIAIIPTADKTKATVQVRVGFKDKDARILPQMGARVSFLAYAPSSETPATESSPAGPSSSTEDKVVIVPSAAVKTGSDRGTGILFVIEGTTVVERTVQLGASHGNDQWILSGLEPGARVAIGNFSKLHDGARIRITQ